MNFWVVENFFLARINDLYVANNEAFRFHYELFSLSPGDNLEHNKISIDFPGF